MALVIGRHYHDHQGNLVLQMQTDFRSGGRSYRLKAFLDSNHQSQDKATDGNVEWERGLD